MLYNIYTTEGYVPLGITDWEHLRVMRLDFNERQLYNHRFVKEDKSIKHLYKERQPNSKLKKIGFLSRDFSQFRPSGQLSISFFKLLSLYKSEFTLFFYSKKGVICDSIFSKIGVMYTEENYDLLAKKIADDNIDILIDMQGLMVDNFIKVLLQKPAPIQIHWLGYPGTMGLSTIDYLVADNLIIPEDSQKYYREKIAYLPHLYQANNPEHIQINQYVMREYFELPNDKFIFTHFNSDYKLDRKTWFEWLDILKRTENTMLVFTLHTTSTDELFIKQLYKDVNICGIDPDRVVYLPKVKREQHFNRLQLFNLGLDTFRINGHTTSADLICAGIPFITLTSETYHNRVGKSILHTLELEDLVCYSFDEYKNKAIELATNPDYYASVKEKIIKNRCKIMFNTHLYTRSFVNLIYTIWDEYHDIKRKSIEHIFLNEETNDVEKKNVPFSPCEITKFNNNYYGTPKFKWVFYENKNSDAPTKVYSNKRNQYLCDYANNDENCVAFNIHGELKYSKGNLIDDKSNGLWVKEKISLPETEVSLNKDYKLPKVTLFFKLIPKMNPRIIQDIIGYLYNQTYLNSELFIISYIGDIPKEAHVFLNEHLNFVKFINNNNNLDISEILSLYTNTQYNFEITINNLSQLNFISDKFKDLNVNII